MHKKKGDGDGSFKIEQNSFKFNQAILTERDCIEIIFNIQHVYHTNLNYNLIFCIIIILYKKFEGLYCKNGANLTWPSQVYSSIGVTIV